MTDPTITILTVNYNTSDFIAVMLEAADKLTYNPYKVIICDNGSDHGNLLSLVSLAKKYDNVEVIFREQSSFGSIGHAEALDLLINKVNTKYTVILDSDCLFLLRKWDEVLINEINDKVKMIGTVQPTKRSGFKPLDFPLPFGVLFDTKTYRDLKISCLPRNIENGEDTCWEWRVKYLENGLAGKTFLARSTRDYHDGPFNRVICTEFYTDKHQGLIASHFGRGASNGLAKYYHKWYYRLPIISKYIKSYVAKSQKKAWMNICHDLIYQQSLR